MFCGWLEARIARKPFQRQSPVSDCLRGGERASPITALVRLSHGEMKFSGLAEAAALSG